VSEAVRTPNAPRQARAPRAQGAAVYPWGARSYGLSQELLAGCPPPCDTAIRGRILVHLAV